MRHAVAALSITFAGLAALPTRAEPVCGTSPDSLCQVDTGQYRISLPDGTDQPGAMIWLHGWGGSANGVMRNTGMAAKLHARGLALIAADGVITYPARPNKNWAVNDGRSYERNDIEFLSQIIEDAVARHGIDRERILLGGFSRGGSMVWDVACKAPDLVRAYAPVAGAFWEPMWTGCEGAVDLFHTHGWTDRTVPLEGRPLGNGTMTQGDVWQSLYILRSTNSCGNRQPEIAPIEGDNAIWLRSWSDCTSGKRIDLMLHPGGHGIPKGWLDRTLDWFEARTSAG
ncbi:MAG: polyhydroxybutyrate depolymerase [Pseudomonadota bacterium]